GTALFARRLPVERRVPFWPEERVRARADARARALADYAARRVPYYRGLLRPGEIRGVADLAELPLLDKAAVRDDPAAFRSSAPAGRPARLRHVPRASVPHGGGARARPAPPARGRVHGGRDDRGGAAARRGALRRARALAVQRRRGVPDRLLLRGAERAPSPRG